jgi:hypothetical protein
VSVAGELETQSGAGSGKHTACANGLGQDLALVRGRVVMPVDQAAEAFHSGVELRQRWTVARLRMETPLQYGFAGRRAAVAEDRRDAIGLRVGDHAVAVVRGRVVLAAQKRHEGARVMVAPGRLLEPVPYVAHAAQVAEHGWTAEVQP